MKCEECGKEILEKSKFCRYCGNVVVSRHNIKLASSDKRFLNYLLDLFIGIIVIAFVVGLILALLGFGEELDSEFINSRVFNYLFTFLYYLLFESLFGRTLGKFVTGTMVVNEDGGKPTFGQILKRSLIRLIPFEPFSFFGNKGNLGEDGKHRPVGWHDKWSRTRVIEIR